jgi:hypothetical protein
MDPLQHDDVQCSVDLFSFRTDKTPTEAMETLFFVTIVCATFNLPYSTIEFVVGAALPPMVIIMVTTQHEDSYVEKCAKRCSVLRLRRTFYQNAVEFS